MNQIMPRIDNVFKFARWPLRRLMQNGTEIPFNMIHIVEGHSADDALHSMAVFICRCVGTCAGVQKISLLFSQPKRLLVRPK
ncbi:hypothetical protein Q3V30_21495 (plasmid) [Erwinia pyri]|uniref:Uncharacterized protein n=1 Tax=Erwinia pyri TaxID=3062598 RepID=A0AA50DN78_9GAMM|nr:hypothetical protein [Erwinia sp. DE2]WLS81059.1 hypothetical protein Q3V30_21495 [Erwinia sp. DE2]